jgi:hypothetical protein
MDTMPVTAGERVGKDGTAGSGEEAIEPPSPS